MFLNIEFSGFSNVWYLNYNNINKLLVMQVLKSISKSKSIQKYFGQANTFFALFFLKSPPLTEFL